MQHPSRTQRWEKVQRISPLVFRCMPAQGVSYKPSCIYVYVTSVCKNLVFIAFLKYFEHSTVRSLTHSPIHFFNQHSFNTQCSLPAIKSCEHAVAKSYVSFIIGFLVLSSKTDAKQANLLYICKISNMKEIMIIHNNIFN